MDDTRHGKYTSADISSRSSKTQDHSENDEKLPNDFTELSIFPTALDVDCESVFLRANKTEGAYRSVNHYLEVQFRLLREDYIRPLRNGIREYQRLKRRDETPNKNTDLMVYHNVKIISLVCNESLEHRIQLDKSRLKNLRWQSCRRLIYGSLVCLSRDDFQTTYFAVVTNGDRKDVREGIIQVKFENCVHDIMDSAEGDTFIMAETSAYFEAYRHVLEGLQEMPTSFPFARYIVECKRDLKPPNYLLSRGLGTTLDISSLLKSGRRVNPQVPVLVPTRWPPLETTIFNQSQYDAVKTALTKELAIIQGPPGTGKTYVGLKVARVLLENRHVWTANSDDKPMLIVCYTNHALDQFLEGILEFCPKGIVRVGCRSKSKQLAKCNLKRFRSRFRRAKKVKLDLKNSIKDCRSKRCILKERLEQASAYLEATTKGVVGELAMKGTMSEKHFTSLVSEKCNTSQLAMISWITQGLLVDTDDSGSAMNNCKSLEQQVTEQILKGKDVQDEGSFECRQISFLPAKARAGLYRYWLAKLRLNYPRAVRLDDTSKQNLLLWCEKSTKEILPDTVLQLVMDCKIFSEIVQKSAPHSLDQSGYCIRTWLGFSRNAKKMQTSCISWRTTTTMPKQRRS